MHSPWYMPVTRHAEKNLAISLSSTHEIASWLFIYSFIKQLIDIIIVIKTHSILPCKAKSATNWTNLGSLLSLCSSGSSPAMYRNRHTVD